MGTKIKGLVKGFKTSLSQIFDDDKQPEIQIGNPTDVKHVAHIGFDGSAVESPSWLKDYETPSETQSGPLDNTGALRETPEVKWVSEDSSHKKARRERLSHRSTRSEEATRDLPVVPKSKRNRHCSMEPDSEDDSSNKSRHTRRHHRGSSEGRREDSRRSSRRKKSKDESSVGGSSSKASDSDVGE